MGSPLSQSQLGVYYACQATVDEQVNYQNPVLLTLPEAIDLQRLKNAVQDAFAAHPYLLSRIEEDDNGMPYATEGAAMKVDVEQLSAAEWQAVQETFGQTMDIHAERLYRAEIYTVEAQGAKAANYLYLDFHHVLADGFTVVLIIKDIDRVYNGKKPSREMMDGSAVAQDELSQREDEALMGEARAWYGHEFAEAAETESLPIPESQNTEGGHAEHVCKHYPLPLSKGEMQAVVTRFGVKENTISTAAWALLLAAYTAEDKASFCTAFWGRSDRRTMGTATMMVHTLPVFVRANAETSLDALFAALDTQTELTRKYQYYAYQDAIKDLELNNQVMFIYQGTVLAEKRTPLFDGVAAKYADLRRPTPGWKLSAELFEHEDSYSLKMVYSSADYSDEYMKELANSYACIIRSMATAESVRDVEYCDAEQTAWLDKRNPSKPLVLPETDSLVARFKARVAAQPDAVCVVAGDTRLTYAEVDRLTDSIDAAYTVPCGDYAVGYTVPRNEQMVLVPLSIAKASKTLLPLDGSYPPERIEYMKQDAARCENADAFVLLYTSGTTGEAKGVMLSERNVLAFCDFHCRYFHVDSESRYASYAGYGFDAFQQDLWSSLISGATLYILPDEIRFDLEAMRAYFDEQGITHSFMTTQVATQMAINYPEMRTLQVLGTGGEKLMSINPPKTYHLYNGYGPTESIAYVCSYVVDHKENNIPIGYPNDTSRLYIVGKNGKRVPWGAAGELLVAGEQVSLGYLNKPDKTAEAFVRWNDERVYRTGDVVRYRRDGAIEFVGRKDGQVKIRGFRIELKEVEAVIRQYPAISDATVQAFEHEDGGKFIAAYIVSDEQVNTEALNAFIMERKPPYMVPAVTMQIDAIPLNQNQKVNNRALPEPRYSSSNTRHSAPPRGAQGALNVLEQALHDMVAKILNTADFDITTDLRMVGLTSIAAIKVATQVFKRFGVQLDAKQLTKGITIQAIENEILSSLLNPTTPTAATATDQSTSTSTEPLAAPLSFAQTGVYFECMKNPTSTLYNIPMRLQLPTDISDDALRQAVETVVRNHPELHVSFKTNETGVAQQVEERALKVECLQMTEQQAEAYRTDFVCPFNLSNDLLCRFSIVRTQANLYLYCDMHHLVCDGASYDIFFNELCALLDGQSIEPELCSYAQFVSEQQAAQALPSFAAAAEFFRSRLADLDGITEVTTDLTNPKPQGETAYVSAPVEWTAAEQLAHTLGVTPAAISLAAVFYALARFTNTEDICITTISNGRSNLRIAGTIGMFVNTLPLTAKIGEQRVSAFIQETAQTFQQTLEHEDYPFARIAADYNLSADIMFAYQMGVLSSYQVHGHTLQTDNLEPGVPKFKIAFYIMEVEGTPSVAIEYDNARYSQPLMHSLAQAVSNAIAAFAQSPDAALRSVTLTNDEQLRLLDSFNQTDVPYDDTQTILSLWRQQAAATPDNIAIVYKDIRLTYKEVDERTEAIAAVIAEAIRNSYSDILPPSGGDRGPSSNTLPPSGGDRGPSFVVSILTGRSEWIVLAPLAAMKAGCAYQPLDPSYPSERLNFMMQDAHAAVLIADQDLRHLVNEYAGPVLFTQELSYSYLVTQPIAPLGGPQGASLFILLYTSGSTGVPKGVMLEHRNLVAFCHWYTRYFNLQPGDKVAAYASFGFDASMMDVYPALTTGATVYIIPEDLRLNLPQLNRYFEAEQITHAFMTTQVGFQFATNVQNHCLRHLAVGGEALASLTPPAHYKMHNGYGPTECTIFTTTYALNEYQQHIPIGKALDNMRLMIMDTNAQRLPFGAAGELWVSGPQVARGYLNQAEKTAQVFVQRDGVRWYRTGDIVRYLPDGNIQFVGRRDGQVKIRGFRIELKEVEAVIRDFEGITDATVQAFDYPNGGKYIAAYIVSNQHIDIQALNDFIKQRKPSYMVPAATMQIDAIPLNQNQKVNKRALPAPQLNALDRQYDPPANDTEQLFCDIFATILSLDKVGATDNFFELGGTSLMVTRVIIEADKAGHHVAYADLFSHPTPRQLAALLNDPASASNPTSDQVNGASPSSSSPALGQANGTFADTTISDFDYLPIHHLIASNTLQSFAQGTPNPLGHVLLTGATGYLGIHVLRELIDSDALSITCLVRGKSQRDAERRLRNLLFYYFSRHFDDLFGTRIFVVNGDVTSDFNAQLSARPNGTLDPSRTFNAQRSIDTVINCAANVKHFSKGTDIQDVNVGGAARCVDFCLKNSARLIHVSTTSIAGLWPEHIGEPQVATPVLTERNLYFGQDLRNQYTHSKFLAERIILDAIIRKELKAKIMRVGNLAPRSYDGEFQINFSTNSYMGRMKIFNMLGCCPYNFFDQPTEFSPIDETARAIVLLSATPDDCTVFHPYNTHTRLLGDVLKGLEKIGKPIRFVEQEEFNMLMQQAALDPNKAALLTTMLAYLPSKNSKPTHVVESNNAYTSQALLRLEFRWTEPDSSYVNRMLTAISQLGFFDV